MLFKACHDAPIVSDFVEEPFDAMAFAVENATEANSPAMIDLGWSVRNCAGCFDAASEPVGVIGFVSQKYRCLSQAANHMTRH